MTDIPAAHGTTTPGADGLPFWQVLLLAVGAGLGAASLYYCQPMLGELAANLGASERATGWVPTLTQLGYATGILLLSPLGDRYDRRSIMLVKAVLLCAALLLAGLAQTMSVLLVASLAVGITATLAQDIVPAAAMLATAAHRGKVVGTVMTGLLLGILLSRVVSGLVAEHFGWRAVFISAAFTVAVLAAALWRGLPRFAPTSQLAYGALLGTLADLWRTHGALRRAALAQGLLSLSFSAFWSTLAVMLHGAPFHLGSAAAGAVGLAGAAGALGAPLAGRIADSRGPELMTRLGAGLAFGSFMAMTLAALLLSHVEVWQIVLCAIGFDLGVQAALISHQSIIYGLDPAARSRLNAVLMTSMFIGMASGAALGSQALAAWGWGGVSALASLAAGGACVVRVWPGRRACMSNDQSPVRAMS